MKTDIKQFDEHTIRCRRLGHEVTFAYCRQESDSLPCKMIRDCWFEKFNVNEFLERHYRTEQMQQLRTPATPKITQLWQIMQQAMENNKV